MVGREDERGRLLEALAGGAFPGALICGAEGLGASRLMRVCVADLERRRRWSTIWLTATEASTSVPLAVFAPLLDTTAESDTLSRIQRAFLAVEDHAEDGTLLAIDDAHLLDEAAATVVRMLIDSGRTRVLMSVRSGCPLPQTVHGLWTAGHLDRIELAPLPERDVDRLLDAAFDAPVATATKAELRRLSQGNPLLLKQLVVAAREAGILGRRDGIWVHEGPLVAVDRLAALAEQRLGGLDADLVGALEFVAVGEPVGRSLVEPVVGREVVRGLEDRGLVAIRQEDRRVTLQTAEPFLREFVLTRLNWARHQEIVHELAEASRGTGLRRREDRARWAAWRLETGAPVDPQELTEAVVRARRLGDPDQATKLADAARHTSGFSAALAIGEARAIAGEHAEASSAFDAAAELASNEHERTAVALSRAQQLMLGQHRPQSALEVLRRAEARCTDDGERDHLTAMKATFLSFAGDLLGSLRVAQRVLARPGADPRAVLSVLTVSTFVQSMLGRPEEALAGIARGQDLVLRLRDELPLAEIQLGINHTYALLDLGRVHEAEQASRTAHQCELDRATHHLGGTWATVYASVLLERGGVEPARPLLTEAALHLEKQDPLGLLPACLSLRAYAAALAGDVDAARADVTLLEAEFGDHHRFVVWHGRAKAWLAAARGDVGGAQAHTLEAARWAEAHQQRSWATWAYHDLVRLGAPELAADALRCAAEDMASPPVRTFATHAQALVRQAPDALASVAERFAGSGYLLYAAEAAGQAAVAHRRANAPREAKHDAALMRSLVRRCPGAATSMLVAPPPELTDRELQVARLAARGLTSPEIAEQLTIAVRTVDNHLHRTYRKLGITDRNDLHQLV